MDRKRIGVLVDGLGRDLRKALKDVAALGAGAVQLPVGPGAPAGLHPDDLSQSAARDIRHTIANLGMTLCSAHADIGMHLHRTDRLDELYERAASQIEWTGYLGVPVLTMSLGAVPEEKDGRAAAMDVLRRIGSDAQSRGVVAALTTGPVAAGQLAEDLAEVGSDHIAANLDPGRLALRGPTGASDVESLAAHLIHVHATDGILGEGRTALGAGDVNWEEILAALEEIGWAGPVVVRVEPGPAAREQIQKATCFLASL